jgi:hypothetical protein
MSFSLGFLPSTLFLSFVGFRLGARPRNAPFAKLEMLTAESD